MGSSFLKYPHDYCPYCYSKMETPTEFECAGCGNVISEKILSEDKENKYGTYTTDYRKLPVCKCGNGAMNVRCSNPDCRNEKNIIPPEKISMVVVLGMRSSGKSTYLLNVLDSDSKKTGASISLKSKNSIEWRNTGVKKVKKLDQLDATDPNKKNYSTVFGIKMADSRKDELVISVTDRPGEDTQSMEKLMKLNYMACADYIILLLDLLNIPGVAAELDEKKVGYTKETENTINDTAVENMVAVLSAKKGKYGKKIPVFVGVSKWDYIEKADIAPPGFSIGCEGSDTVAVVSPKGKFDSKRWKSNSEAVRKFLSDHGEANICTKLESYFNSVNYFAFSTFGNSPEFNGGIAKFSVHNPCHIMDPFYYILHDKKRL